MSQTINVHSQIKKGLRIRQIVEILVLSVVYFVAARIGQLTAIPPGNITAVWIPSGIILAAVLLRGYYLWPGIFLGAFFGNAYAYIDLTSFSTAMPAVFSGISNGIGDSLCAVVSAYLIKRSTSEIDSFLTTKTIISFLIYGVILGPFISALFGITSLCALGFIDWNLYVYSFVTWGTGDSVGVLLLTPFIICLVQKTKGIVFNIEKALYTLCIIFISLVILQIISFQSLIVFAIIIPLPLLLWSALRLDARITCFSVIVFSSVMIVATILDRGIFTGDSLNDKLVQLQLFILTISVTIYVFLGVVSDRNRIHNNLVDEIYEHKKTEEKIVIYQARLKELVTVLSLTEERERRYLSEQLHDGIGQALAVLKMRTQELDPHIAIESKHVMKETLELIDKIIQETRSLTFEISPPVLYKLGLEPAIEWLVEQSRKRYNLEIDFVSNVACRKLDRNTSSFLFKSVRELVFNIAKHAKASSINILAQIEDNRIRIAVEDDGIGFSNTKTNYLADKVDGFGLFNMRERLEQLGGNLTVKSKPGQGSTVALEIPIPSSL